MTLMRNLGAAALLLLCGLGAALPAPAQQGAAPAPAGRPAESARRVVVELFTSQGCSSCPPADRYLGELAQRPGVLALGFHVDYWNYIGWTDPFASEIATKRQRDYGRKLGQRFVYTPQMVVNGAMQGVGSDRDEIGGLIRWAEAHPASETQITLARSGDGLAIHVGAGQSGGPAPAKPATLWLVSFDRERSTEVARGENGGRTLRNYQIVRSFRSLATWTGAPLDIVLPAAEAAELARSGVAVILQTEGTGPIIAAAALDTGT